VSTVALAIQQGFSARILLQTEVLDTLLDAGVDVVVLTQDPSAIRHYLDSRGLSHVAVEQLDDRSYAAQAQGLSKNLFRRLRAYGIRDRSVDNEFEMALKDTWRARSPGGLTALLFIWLVTRLMRWIPAFMRLVVALENRLDSPRVHDEFFETYRPDALVLTSLGTFDYDHYVIREAHRHGVRVVSFVLSWDNPTINGLGVNLCDSIIVWSEVMKQELVELHRLPPETVAVNGVPHYDFYVNGKVEVKTRDWLGEEFGFDPDKRIIMFAPRSPNTCLDNVDVATIICEAIRDGRLAGDCHLLTRLHPIYYRRNNGRYLFADELAEWDRLLDIYGTSCLSIDRPAMIDGDLNLLMPDSEIPKLATLLRHSEVVVNQFSTLNLEASIYDTPTVNVAFNIWRKRPTGFKVARYNVHYDEVQTHNQRVVNSGGTSVAHSADELIEQINRYLENASLHSDGRKRMVANECGVNLGRAGRAVGETILDSVGVRA